MYRQDSEPEMVLNQVEEVFLSLADDSSQLDFPVLYAVAEWAKFGQNCQKKANLRNCPKLRVIYKHYLKKLSGLFQLHEVTLRQLLKCKCQL